MGWFWTEQPNYEVRRITTNGESPEWLWFTEEELKDLAVDVGEGE